MSEINPAAYVASRRVGDATFTAINDAFGLSDIIKILVDVPEPTWRNEVEADADGNIRLSYNTALVRLSDATILIDLGFDDPSPASQWAEPEHQRTPGLVAGLATLGVAPADVTHVLITHNHADHIAGGTTVVNGERVPRFARARHYIGRLDWEGVPAAMRPDSLLATHLGPIARRGQLELVDTEREVVPGVTLIPAPGETPGHLLVRIESKGDTAYFLGDLFHHPCEVTHVDWVARGRDPVQMRRSRERLIDAALARDALLLTAHIPFPGFGRLVRTPNGARWQALEANEN